MHVRKFSALTAVAATRALALTACGGGGNDPGADGNVSMTFWHNSTTGEGEAYWEETVAAFEAASPGVKISIQAIQNEDMDGKLQTALNSGDAPDIFMARGGGKLTDVVSKVKASGVEPIALIFFSLFEKRIVGGLTGAVKG